IATASVTSAALMMAGMLRYDSAACGGPMQTVSSASSTCLVLKSAVECTATVLIPSSRQARRMRSAISPRLAITTFSIIALFDDEQRLAELDRLTVLGEDRRDAPCLVGFDLVHHLHRFDDAEYLADLDFHAELDEGLGPRSGGGVISADHRRGDGLVVVARLVLAGRSGGQLRRGGRRDGRGLSRRTRGGRRRARMTADAHGFLAFGNLQLRDARLLQQLDQFLDFTNVHSNPFDRPLFLRCEARTGGFEGQLVADGTQPHD